MVYADYEFYKTQYLGTILEEPEFNAMALRASAYIDYLTFGKAEKNAEKAAVKLACCALAEQEKAIETSKAASASSVGEKKSETVGSWSASYRSSAEILNESQAQLKTIATQYLATTGLLYRGWRCAPCTCHTL